MYVLYVSPSGTTNPCFISVSVCDCVRPRRFCTASSRAGFVTWSHAVNGAGAPGVDSAASVAASALPMFFVVTLQTFLALSSSIAYAEDVSGSGATTSKCAHEPAASGVWCAVATVTVGTGLTLAAQPAGSTNGAARVTHTRAPKHRL